MGSALLAVAIVVPAVLAAQMLAGPSIPPATVSSWTMWGGDVQRTFRLAEAGHAGALDFAPWHLRGTYALGTGSAYLGAMTGDLDGDGREEIVALKMGAFLGNGGSRIEVWSSHSQLLWGSALESPVGHPALLDWDADGRMDIFVAQGLRNEVYRGDGALLWSAPLADPWPCGPQCSDTGAIDVTGDGLPDPFLTTDPNQHRVYGVDGRTGVLLWDHAVGCGWHTTPPAAIHVEDHARVLMACRPNLGAQSLGGSMVFGVDVIPGVQAAVALDAPEDLPLRRAVVNWTWSFLPERGPEREPAPPGVQRDVVSIVVGDVTGDGGPDVVVGLKDPHAVYVFSRDGELLVQWTGSPDRFLHRLALAQLDGDPALEIVDGAAAGEGVVAYDWRGGRLDRWWVSHEAPAGGVTALAVADFDGDGLDEIVLPIQVGGYCESDGNGFVAVLSHAGHLRWLSDPMPKCVIPVRGLALADLDKDGHIEIIQPAASDLLVYGTSPQPGRVPRGR